MRYTKRRRAGTARLLFFGVVKGMAGGARPTVPAVVENSARVVRSDERLDRVGRALPASFSFFRRREEHGGRCPPY